MSIPAIKAVGIGRGPQVATLPGSRIHDEILPPSGATAVGVSRPTNNAGGLEGGITNGEDLRVTLYMSVNPGFGGQTFIPRSESKVREVRRVLDLAGNTSAPIEIDGGIDIHTAPRVVAAGARILVAGAAIFHSSDPEQATRELKAVASGAAQTASR